jgi:hypothetical protein
MAAESLDGYIRTIKKGDTDSVDYIKSLEGMRSIYKELYNLTDAEAASLSNDFLADEGNMALLERAMAGDTNAWNGLQTTYRTTHNKTSTPWIQFTGDTTKGKDKAFSEKIAKIQHEA